MLAFVQSFSFMLTLLNPFLMVVYLTDVIRQRSYAAFAEVMVQAGIISSLVFCLFAVVGDVIFSIIQAEFASFQIFGGIIFLLISIQFVFEGTTVMESLRGDSKALAGAIAMPVFIGPGTISGSVLAGERLTSTAAVGAIVLAVAASITVIMGLKWVHDTIKPRYEDLIDGYVNIAGRVTALYLGTISVQMIMQGLQVWIGKF
jgi:small neutral amino acid transporter SnatA (MarC family)